MIITKIFDNLQDELLKIAQEATGEKRDSRFKAWAKTITAVDQKATNGYAFEGNWVNKGTVELEIKPHVFLVAFTHGSRKYNVTEYVIVMMENYGELNPTEIRTDSRSSGWALRIKDDVAALLDSLATQEPELSARDRFLATLRKRLPGTSDEEIITAALSLYEMHTRDRWTDDDR